MKKTIPTDNQYSIELLHVDSQTAKKHFNSRMITHYMMCQIFRIRMNIILLFLKRDSGHIL